MPSKSKSQQRLFGMAYAVRKGELSKSEVDDAVLDIVNSDMSTTEIKKFASTSHKHLKEHLEDSLKF